MTRILQSALLAASAAALAASTGAMAQRGGPPAGVGHGPPAGVGNPGGGMPDMPGAGRPDSFPGGGQSTVTTGADHWGSTGRPDNPGRPDVERAMRPDAANQHAAHQGMADNPRRDEALTSALTRSGVTLPEGGLQTACEGFASLGACVSALHVAHNLDLPGGFAALKTEMTGDARLSLGAAIRKLKPDADAEAQVRSAEARARADLKAG